MILNCDDLILSVVDVQEKLIGSINNNSVIIDNILKIIFIANELKIPIILTEQYPRGIGKTIKEISMQSSSLFDFSYVEKTSFSCYSSEEYRKILSIKKKKQVLICGIETHICVFQTAIELYDENFEVFVAQDAVGSRKETDKISAINRMQLHNINLLSLEMILFELLRDSKHEKFRELSKLIK